MKSFAATLALLALVAVVAAIKDDPHMLSDEFIELVRSKAETWTVSYKDYYDNDDVTFPLFVYLFSLVATLMHLYQRDIYAA